MDIDYFLRTIEPFRSEPASPQRSNYRKDSRPCELAELAETLARGLPVLTPDEVRSEAKARSEAVFGHLNNLKNIIDTLEPSIQKRWINKTKEKRKKILLQAFPDIALCHCPDLQALKAISTNAASVASKSALMWPQINLEDLLKPRHLLIFLNSRGRNPPDAFAMADWDACRLGAISRAVDIVFLNHHVMMFTGRRTPETYGELVAWNDHPEAIDWFIKQRGLPPGAGLHTLKVQERLYLFLVDCCKAILHEISADSIEHVRQVVQPEPLSVISSDTGVVSLANVAAEAPYRLPANLDIKRVYSIIAAKYSAAEDHFWALREDPGYFAETMLDFSEHAPERLRNINGHLHPTLTDPRTESIFSKHVIKSVIVSAVASFQHWGVLCERIKKLLDLQKAYKAQILPEKDLPLEFALAFYETYHHLVQLAKTPLGFLKLGFHASPPIRPFFMRRSKNSNETVLAVEDNPVRPKTKSAEALCWIFSALADEDASYFYGFNALVDELEYLIQTDLEAKTLISSWVADKISNLAVYSQAMHQIELYQPWSATFQDGMLEHEEEIRKDFAETSKNLDSL